jgi:hypothetical protein
MAKKSNDVPRLFADLEVADNRRLRRQRALFIPRFLNEESKKIFGPEQDRAYEIALRWADRETKGLLLDDRETTIDTQFLDQMFGEGLATN